MATPAINLSESKAKDARSSESKAKEVKARTLMFKLGKEVSKSVRIFFVSRGWTEYKRKSKKVDDEEWNEVCNLFWQDKAFQPQTHKSLMSHQVVNHFQNTKSICRKDHLARTMQQMRYNFGGVYNFTPRTFVLAKDNDEFALYFETLNTQRNKERLRSAVWISKPCTGRRGENIFLFESMSDLKTNIASGSQTGCVVQRYLDDPYLIGGYKFDLRLYVFVPRFWPLQCYLYRKGLVRFGSQKYDLCSLENKFCHLTNSSVNKTSPNLNEDKEEIGTGCKWTLQTLFDHLKQRGHDTGAL